jgi:hypothetical protein
VRFNVLSAFTIHSIVRDGVEVGCLSKITDNFQHQVRDLAITSEEHCPNRVDPFTPSPIRGNPI